MIKKSYQQLEKRRELVTAVLLFCMVCILYIMYKGVDNGIYTHIIDNAFFLLGSVVGMYIFGRGWSDYMQNKSFPSSQSTKEEKGDV